MSINKAISLIPLPLLPGEKGRKNLKILAPLPWERVGVRYTHGKREIR
jgi:hypothetical protein